MRYPPINHRVAEAAAGRIKPGGRFRNLQIERELGRGAFSVVYLAQDTRNERPVALKVLRVKDCDATKEEKSRMLREIRLVDKLASPHIVSFYRVHDLGEAGAAFEMEYLDAGTLDDVLDCGRRLSLDKMMRVMRGVLLALDAAHSRSVLHRDVKPGNVLLDCDGSVKLGDFGLGRQVGEGRLSGSDEGCIMGTPLYMSPEVLMASSATFASDLWSAGVLIYRLVTGRAPFPATNLPSLLHAIRDEEPFPMDADTPVPIRRLVARCLQKEPEDRPRSAREMLAIVEGIQPEDTHAANPG